jgi:hypothetical protein
VTEQAAIPKKAYLERISRTRAPGRARRWKSLCRQGTRQRPGRRLSLRGCHSSVPKESAWLACALEIPRLDREDVLYRKRPEVPLAELAGGRLERLLALIGRWLGEVQAHLG